MHHKLIFLTKKAAKKDNQLTCYDSLDVFKLDRIARDVKRGVLKCIPSKNEKNTFLSSTYIFQLREIENIHTKNK